MASAIQRIESIYVPKREKKDAEYAQGYLEDIHDAMRGFPLEVTISELKEKLDAIESSAKEKN
jgi:hypothetical protein